MGGVPKGQGRDKAPHPLRCNNLGSQLRALSKASLHDVNVLDIVPYEVGGFYVMDKAYIDFARLYAIHLQKAFFVTRAKENLRFKRMYSRPSDKDKGIKFDQIGRLEGHYSKKGYPKNPGESNIMTLRPKRNSCSWPTTAVLRPRK